MGRLRSMSSSLYVAACVWAIAWSSAAAPGERPIRLASPPRVFEINQGQTDGAVRFLSRGPEYDLFLTDSALVLNGHGGGGRPEAVILRPRDAERTGEWVGEHPLRGTVNYLRGRESGTWRRGVPTFGSVRRDDLFAGIDAIVYAAGRNVEFDLEMHPNADPRLVAFVVEGARGLRVDERGDLVVTLASSAVRLPRPRAFQVANHRRERVDVSYRLVDERTFGVVVEGHDPGRALVVDPIIEYSSFLGGAGQDFGSKIATDSAGYVYLVGSTQSPDFPTTPGVVRNDMTGSDSDAFVVKLTPSGDEVVFATYLGGNRLDVGEGIAVDDADCVYVAGHTLSEGFPLVNALSSTLGMQAGFFAKLDANGSELLYSSFFGVGRVTDIAVDESRNVFIVGVGQPGTVPTFNGPTWTGPFVAKIHSSGSVLLYSTGLGGTASGRSDSVALDASGNAVVGGVTSAADLLVHDALQGALRGPMDGFVAKVTSTPSPTLEMGETFDAENGGQPAEDFVDFATFRVVSGRVDLVRDSSGGTSVAPRGGEASVIESRQELRLSPTFSIWPEANRSLYRLRLGLLGGPGAGVGRITVRVGDMFSETFEISGATPPTIESRQFLVPTEARGRLALAWDAQGSPPLVSEVVLEKVGDTSATLVFSTYLGGGGTDAVRDVAVDSEGVISVVGVTDSVDFPTVNAHQPTGGGGLDAFLTRLTPTGSEMLTSSYLGGSGDDEGSAVTVDASGVATIGGSSGSPDMPQVAPVQDGYRGATDGFVARIRRTGEAELVSYLGGGEYDAVLDVVAVSPTTFYATGQTVSADFPIASGLQPLHGGWNDAFLTRVTNDGSAPGIECAAPDESWHAADVAIACTAADSDSGLAYPAEASFSLTTSVPPESETAEASTGTRLVCDRSGNCSIAGPVRPVKVDRKAPVITIASPSPTTYVLGASVTAAFGCSDSGSGVASCLAPVAVGDPVLTGSPGTRAFSVVARDYSGNERTETVAYRTAYAICPDYDTERAYRSGSTLPVRLRLCDAAGANASSATVGLHVTGLVRISSDTSAPVADAGRANPDSDFRHTGDSGPNAGYIYNLSLSGLAQGTYELRFVAAGDPTTHAARFQVR